MIAYTITPSSVNLLLHGRMRTLNSTHPNFSAVREALKNYGLYGASPELEARIADLVDIPQFIAKVTAGRVKVGDNAVYFDDREVHGVIAKRLLGMLGQGFNISPLARFLDRLMSNPIPTAADELYLWMEQSELPLTDDGCFLAFKKVNNEYLSYHDNKTDNSIGSKLPLLSEDRYDTDRRRTCSSGYHFCSYDYLPTYYGNTGRVVICKIAPEDVVSIPDDYSNAKGRARTYEIIGEVPESEARRFFDDKPVITEFGTYKAAEYNEDGDANYDWDWYDNGPDAEDFGLHEDYFSPENNALVLAIINNGDDSCYDTAAMRRFVHENNLHAVANMFIWANEQQDFTFWGKVNDGMADDYEIDKAKYIVGKYLEIIDQAATTDQPKTNGLVGWSDSTRHMTDTEILKIVEAHGQRGASRLLNVPRTTLQDWLKKIETSA